MKGMQKKELLKEFSGLWYKIFSSNKLNVCTESLADVSPIEINIMRLAAANPDIILREICQQLNIVNSTLTSAINRLEKRRFIKRIISSRDLRSFGLELTEEGRNALNDHLEGEERVLNNILESLESDEEKESFVRMFKKIVDNIVGE